VRPLVPLAALALALAAAPAAAQVVNGKLLERGTDRPVAGASVELIGGGAVKGQAVTDSIGEFLIVVEDAGSYRVSVRRVGYAPAVSRQFPVDREDTTSVVVRLVAGAVLLAPVEAVAKARPLPPTLVEFYDRVEENRSGRFLTRDDIDARHAMRTSDLLVALAGVSIQTNRRGGTRARTRACEPMVYIDGVYVPTYGMSLDDLVRPHDLEGIEVYSSASLPPSFVRQRAPSCGAILFWTRIEN
jgi:hypothetical protein